MHISVADAQGNLIASSGPSRRSTSPTGITSSIRREPTLERLHIQADAGQAVEAVGHLYAQRMGIEQVFRDTKNIGWGNGFHAARSRSN